MRVCKREGCGHGLLDFRGVSHGLICVLVYTTSTRDKIDVLRSGLIIDIYAFKEKFLNHIQSKHPSQASTEGSTSEVSGHHSSFYIKQASRLNFAIHRAVEGVVLGTATCLIIAEVYKVGYGC